MRKLKFDRNRYGNGLLIDSADMTEFDRSIVEAVPDFHLLGSIEQGSGSMRIGTHRLKVRSGSIITITPGQPVDLTGCTLDRATGSSLKPDSLISCSRKPTSPTSSASSTTSKLPLR
ncbi:MAG: AraC family ligand binding domain-containing protein [Flavobacteriales bacterium]|nr:AraC family ligand binding domain-containing protein [Flavobacteriales bacterium]